MTIALLAVALIVWAAVAAIMAGACASAAQGDRAQERLGSTTLR
jgi:hypothetical protein